MMNFIKVLIAIVIIAVLTILQNVFSAKKIRRIRQFPMILIVFIVMIAGVVLFSKFPALLDPIVKRIPFLFRSTILLLNLILLLAVCILKLLLKPLINFLGKKEKLVKLFALSFYEYDDTYEEWFLKKNWVSFRKYFLGIVVGLAFVCGLFTGLTWVKGPEHSLWMIIFPCAALAFVNEIYCYINGLTKEEYEYSVTGDDADSRRISNYYKLRAVFEQLLPEPLLTAHTGNEFAGKETASDMIQSLRESEDKMDQITGEFFELNGRYKTADIDGVQASLDLIHRRNVIFFNPFYKDLKMYITLPIARTLLSGKNCVILCGRNNTAEDVKTWVTGVLQEYSHMRYLWRVKSLTDEKPDCEVGVLTFTQLYDKRVLNMNREFLQNTDFVFLVEPSIMLNTSQIALSILAEEMSAYNEKPVYCICDRYTDGLVDTLSHLLRSEITDVVAMPVPHCNYTALSWNADGDFRRQELFDKQTKFLGGGTELAAIAVKNQIPQVTWYSERKTPVRDVKWIAGQYHSTICRYMNQPAQQKSLYEKIKFVSTLWTAEKTKEQFLIAEDEFCNMFGVMRAFLSRGENQVFVNVLSENYLLRDYMRCNRQVFMSNPNAVPSLVPDYAKTERNTILKLILMMSLRPVEEEEVLRELHLVGIDTNDAHAELKQLVKRYTFADDSIFTVNSIKTITDQQNAVLSNVYSISEDSFTEFFAESIKNAYYILEEEENEKNYIDAKFYGHVTQTILPGQLVTYDGKYYLVKYISPQSGVVLRRASDLYDGRKYYRQVRNYHLDHLEEAEVVSVKKIMDIEFAELRTDFTVTTTGYLELKSYHDLRSARLIDFEEDASVNSFTRSYRNKSILRIKLPESDSKLCFTICFLLSEVFRSVFPDGWQYLTAITSYPEDIDGMLNYVVYPGTGAEEGYIYIVEDSDLDLGLLDAVEKNFMKLMELIADFLDWHFEKMREPAHKDAIPEKIQSIEREEAKRKGFISKMLGRIRQLFGGKKEQVVSVESVADTEAKVPAAPETVETQPVEASEAEETAATEPEAGEVEETAATEPEASDAEETAATEPEASEAEETAATEPEAGAAEETADVPQEASEEESQAQITQEGVSVEETEEKEGTEESKAEAEKVLLDKTEVSEIQAKAEEFTEDDFEPKDTSDPDLVHIDGTDIFDNAGLPEDNDYFELSFQEMGIVPITKTRYQKECYLKFGFEEIDERLHVEELRQYLRVRGWCNNSLTLARKRDSLEKNLLDVQADNQCDFCGLPLSGVSYDVMNDGRIRCNDCSASEIETVEEFRELFNHCVDLMGDFYGIQYRVPIRVRVTNAREVAKGAGMIFRPSKQYAARVLGFAQEKRGKFSLVIENGSPRLAAIDTIVHEMTHIWQYLNWNEAQILQIYSMNSPECTMKARDIVYEGMAMWASVQYLYQIGETYYASRQELLNESREDAYGIGFRLYRERYQFVKDSSMVKYSPFADFPALEPDDVRAAVKQACGEEECKC